MKKLTLTNLVACIAMLVAVAVFSSLAHSTRINYLYPDYIESASGSITALTVTNLTATNLIGSPAIVGEVSASSVTATNEVSGATGDFSGAFDIDGQVTIGAAGTKSTMTAAGALTTHGAIESGGAITATAGLHGTTGAFTSNVTVGGFFQLYSRTQGEIEAITATAVGQAYYCNDCTATTVCISSATNATSWVSTVDPGTACD